MWGGGAECYWGNFIVVKDVVIAVISRWKLMAYLRWVNGGVLSLMLKKKSLLDVVGL